MHMLSLEAVYKQYGIEPLLEEVTFSLEHNEKIGIIGANGSGKTTLLRLIAGVEPPDRGRVTVARGLLLGYLPQNPSFEADQKVLDAVFDQGNETLRRLHDYEAACQALEAAGGQDEHLLRAVTDLAHQLDVAGGWELEAKAKAILNRLGIEDTDTPVSTLSGGQRKRVALARALILRPDLLILDEPTVGLDIPTRKAIVADLHARAASGIAVLWATHLIDEVWEKDRLVVLHHGVVEAEGDVAEVLESASAGSVAEAFSRLTETGEGEAA